MCLSLAIFMTSSHNYKLLKWNYRDLDVMIDNCCAKIFIRNVTFVKVNKTTSPRIVILMMCQNKHHVQKYFLLT